MAQEFSAVNIQPYFLCLKRACKHTGNACVNYGKLRAWAVRGVCKAQKAVCCFVGNCQFIGAYLL